MWTRHASRATAENSRLGDVIQGSATFSAMRPTGPGGGGGVKVGFPDTTLLHKPERRQPATAAQFGFRRLPDRGRQAVAAGAKTSRRGATLRAGREITPAA